MLWSSSKSSSSFICSQTLTQPHPYCVLCVFQRADFHSYIAGSLAGCVCVHFSDVYVRDTFRASHLLAAKRREYKSTKILLLLYYGLLVLLFLQLPFCNTENTPKKLFFLSFLRPSPANLLRRKSHAHSHKRDASPTKCLREFSAYTQHSTAVHIQLG